jgi:outer membrane protein assembly factor BamB
VLDAAQHVFIGQPDGTAQLKEFTHAGNPVATFSPAPESRGTDWNDLATDQCTMFYTSEGTHVKRFDVCKNLQLTDFAALPSGPAYALRIRPNGEVLVAAKSAVYRLDSLGNLLQTYPLPPNEGSFLFALNLDPNGSSFWTAGYSTGNVYKINIATGVIETQFKAGNVGCCASGLAVAGEITVARGSGRIYLPAIPVTYHAP